jgi:hypothetical protein
MHASKGKPLPVPKEFQRPHVGLGGFTYSPTPLLRSDPQRHRYRLSSRLSTMRTALVTLALAADFTAALEYRCNISNANNYEGARETRTARCAHVPRRAHTTQGSP